MAIPFAEHEWRHNSDVYNRKQYPLMLSSAYTIHKSQSKTLDKVVHVIDLGTTEKCSGMTLVGLSCVRKLRHLLLRPFSYERLKKETKRNNCRLYLDTGIYKPATSKKCLLSLSNLLSSYIFLIVLWNR